MNKQQKSSDEEFENLSYAQRNAILDDLRAQVAKRLDELHARLAPATPTQKPVTQRAPKAPKAPTPRNVPIGTAPKAPKAPTKKMGRAMQRFDAMTDAQQVDSLRGMWGDA